MVETDGRLRVCSTGTRRVLETPDAAVSMVQDSMTTKATNDKEGNESANERRARWERMSMTVLDDEGAGYVNVRNDSYGDDANSHVYSVRVENGEAVSCSCPHAVHRGAHCKHQVAVENAPLVVSSASAAETAYAPVATDGGRR